MEGIAALGDLRELVDDRPDEGVFRVDRSVYTDPSIFEREMTRVFEKSWVFLAHESQAKAPGDYFSTYIGRQPVYLHRGKDGELRCFVNACAHRGAILTPCQHGNANALTCRFHGWTYSSDGRCIKIKNEKEGYPEEEFDRSRFNLTQIPKLESYRGFVFGALTEDVPPLPEFLAGARAWVDLLADQSPDGLEVLPGYSSYVIHGNWKMQCENGVDGYHVGTVHRVFAATVMHREQLRSKDGMAKTETGRMTGGVKTGSYDFGNGHMGIWAERESPEAAPIYERKPWLDEQYDPKRVEWIVNRGRNLFLFPNVLLMDNPSSQIRMIRPIAPDKMEVTVRCIAPVGESKQARAARLRKFEDFYLSSGMATSDDLAALEDTHVGSLARAARWNDFSRGRVVTHQGPDEDAKAIGCEAVTSTNCWDHETLFHGFYRHWRELMERA